MISTVFFISVWAVVIAVISYRFGRSNGRAEEAWNWMEASQRGIQEPLTRNGLQWRILSTSDATQLESRPRKCPPMLADIRLSQPYPDTLTTPPRRPSVVS